MISHIKIFSFCTALLCFTAPAMAEKAERQVIDISQTTCQNFLDADVEEAHDILVFHHGFLKGSENDTVIHIDTLSDMSDEVSDTCTEKPDMIVLDVFKSLKKAK
ncbi:MAG: HdeA/HdeB family chaperone [Pseudomonadota bacterium]